MRYLAVAGVVGTTVLGSHAARADVVTDWNATAVDIGRKLALGPNPASRLVAITQIAVFEAVNSVGREYAPYHAYITPNGPVNLDATVAQAAHDALVALAPSKTADLDFELSNTLADIPDGPEKTNGIELGFLSASSIFVRRLSDGSSASVAYAGSTDVGKWRPTPRVPEFTDAPTNTVVNPPLAASDPQWGAVVPFGLISGDQFRPAAPPLLASEAYATALNEVKDIGSGASATRTPEQTQIAKFWAQQTHIPFNDVARTVANRKHLTIPEKAHLFALLNIALADARIAVWEGKYQYGYWRPITAIRSADLDDNAATDVDATWNSLLDTPNHPEYVSGHSATGSAGATVLAAILGDANGFALHSDSLVGVTREFDSFSAAAAENALSRLYGGIHYRFSNDAGLALGATVASYELANELVPVPVVIPGGEGGAAGVGGDGGQPSEAGAAGALGTNGGTGGTSVGGTSNASGGAAGEPSSGGEPATGGGTGGSSTSGSGGSSGKGGTSATAGKGGTTAQGGEAGEPAAGAKGGAAGKGGTSGKGGGGGTAGTAASDDSGCNCAVPHQQKTSSMPWLFALALAAFGKRRRARDRR
ncbi:MAG TPA: vanadium-dependent haloperoxidase [Polyangiaceae bacterium]|nr:vanadium-dependent haloperoxidase [Polyangiaceae bacterium]